MTTAPGVAVEAVLSGDACTKLLGHIDAHSTLRELKSEGIPGRRGGRRRRSVRRVRALSSATLFIPRREDCAEAAPSQCLMEILGLAVFRCLADLS
ncbi:hypothetical protein R3L02_42335 [Streptomyces scabiei]|uniref:hypothetical protein n=1 Tax=Streptomyces scabiei TaxID=1930 RepID=UPI00298ED92D|nr:hypothetical protein [Streptomyces scabiei]MDW8478388.1 hypothetical protein [Streptomyces scabiei]